MTMATTRARRATKSLGSHRDAQGTAGIVVVVVGTGRWYGLQAAYEQRTIPSGALGDRRRRHALRTHRVAPLRQSRRSTVSR